MYTKKFCQFSRNLLGFDVDANQIKHLEYIYKTVKNETARVISVTGGPGTGKSRLVKCLHTLFEYYNIHSIVAATTGLAACNVDGVTINSLLKIYEDTCNVSACKINFNVLIIDEVSMLNRDTFDSIYNLMQKKCTKFSIILVGDQHQLPPINDDSFTNSINFMTPTTLSIHLEKFYRHDLQYVQILQQLLLKDLKVLDTLNTNAFSLKNYDDALQNENLVIFCTNKRAGFYNNLKHGQLVSKGVPEYLIPISECNYEKKISLKSQVHSLNVFTTDLRLCVGDWIICTKNCRDIKNGQRGVVVAIRKESILVRCEEKEIKLEPIVIITRDASGEIYRQSGYPIKLGWALTVHKAQGLEFNTLYIDLSEAFCRGQTYTALSRVKSLRGLALLTPLCVDHILRF